MGYYINEDGQRIFYEDQGVGHAIICIHPPGMGRKVFAYQQELSMHFRLILPDLSGHGESDTFIRDPGIEDYAKELLGLVNHLKLDQVFLFGYSAGGSVAQEFAIQFPERVKGLILSGAFPKVNTSLLKLEFLAGMKWLKRNPVSLAKLLSRSHFKNHETKVEQFYHILKSDVDVWHSFYRCSLTYDCTRHLYKLTMPLLLLYGTRAEWINHQAPFYRSCPKANLVVVDKAYHQLPATHSEVVNQAVLDFFKRSYVHKN
ncbi:AB hydrolase superfamily protein YvaM [Halobacillus andaensis]|uniref:AB hydrolase superfamily protein YvaM n=1 Tax=Halobacillus andaensis TaxID=1176239 RepID=A0A917BDX9_HALAA|nr:alpha/beta hydrolase [Halobacillus andaensis]MBP2006282.1 pimeloyl-ACP methyl ester carboxylesterase [Halobacillus andaensis]GGF33973.1 AB hydrolase superfamily protein YvaM [Halobacillus andaensis]